MSQTYNLGKVAITPRGAYSSTAQYTPLDILSYNGSSYLVLQNCMGVTPPNATYYMVVASKGDTGSSGASPTIAAGTVTMTPAGTSASVTNVGTNVNASFNFTLPSGNMIYTGTGVTGTSTTPTVFSGSGVSNAGVGDIYINTSTVAFYRCAVGGAASTAKWAFLTYAVPNGSVTANKIANGAVTQDKINDDSVNSDKILDGSVIESKLGSDVTATLENKANVDGAYEQMTVGNAEQLVSTVGVEDSSPYTFRTTGGSADVGDRMNLKAVVGGTVVWNQLAAIPSSDKSKTANGVTITDNRDGSFTVSTDANGATANTYLVTGSLPVIKDHKYFFKSAPIGGSVSTFYAYMTGSGVVESRTDLGNGCIQKCLSNGTASVVGVYVANGAIITTPLKFIPQIFDLTAMFGSTIADYAYTLESGTAGAGIAWLKKYGYFTKPYYPYKAAALESVKTSAHKTVGFNQWDEEYRLGYYDSNGVFRDSTSGYMSSKNKISVIPSTSYHIKVDVTTAVYICYYDGNGTFVERVNLGSIPTTQRDFTTPSYCYFINFSTGNAYGTTYNHDICINLHWDGERDGEYEPYEEHTYALDDVELRGIPKLDASNNLYYDGDEYAPDGTVTRKYGIVDLGTLDWQKTSGKNNLFNTRTSLSTAAYGGTNSDVCKAICARYVAASSTSTYSNETDKTVSFTSTGYCYIEDTAYTDAATFKAAMSGVYLVYELATPTTESADPYTELQICDDFGVEEFVDAATRDFEMPCGSLAVYRPNLRAKLEMSPNSPSDGNGDYIVRQTDGLNEYVLFSEVKELPDAPTSDGTYRLVCTVADGVATYSWTAN